MNWSGFVFGNQELVLKFTHETVGGILELTAAFQHYGHVNNYGCLRKSIVSNYYQSSGGLGVIDLANVSSANGGGWEISREGQNVIIKKIAGTYAGPGPYFVTIKGVKGLQKVE